MDKLFTGDHFNAGENNPAYVGDKAKYGAIHCWVRRRKYKPVHCELCGKIKDFLELALREGRDYTRNINDYWYICRDCHMLTDGRHVNNKIRNANIKRENIRCQYCGKAFHPKKQSSKFCCLPCYRLWNVGENHWHYKKGGDNYVC